MMRSIQLTIASLAFTLSLLTVSSATQAADNLVKISKGNRIAYIGNAMADRMQHHAWLETYIHAMHPEHQLVFRNLGFTGDEVKTRPRSASFGSPDQWLTKVQADIVFGFFGYNEALRGEAGLPGFTKDLGDMIDGMKAQKYNGKAAPQLVLFSPIAHENLHSPHLPDGTANNKNLELYTAAMAKVCQQKGVPFVDLFHSSQQLYQDAKPALTMNGIHLLEHGNQAVAQSAISALFPSADRVSQDDRELERIRQIILDKNLFWFNRYRVVDGYNVFGGRSKLSWFGQSNYDVMQREMEIFDVMTANRDTRVWAAAQGGDLTVTDDNLPSLLKVKTNRPGKLADGSYSYFGGKEAIDKMKVAEGMQVNLFASEEMFPELINPVQMAVDTDGRLFASVWPSYPHWNPTEPRTDRILCLPDENRDGVADKCVIFADKLNSITGFEFWGGGVLVAAPPEIWFLKDTDGDDKADVKIRMLQGLSSADTHHSANAFVIGPDGGLYWSRGIFNVANMETPTKTYRSTKSGVHRFDPRTFEMSFHFPIGPNPHGDVFDQWGFQFANDGTSGTGSYVNIGKGIGNRQWFKKRVRPVAATGILSSTQFPEENNGNFLICNCIGFLGVLQHEVKFNGAEITAEEVEPILVSSDPNFRPTDIEVGGDGALYVSDWANALIGHMQHNMRDPNRDHAHGRIYRVTYKGRPLVKPMKMKGKPVTSVLPAFLSKVNSVRYRARLELSGRDTKTTMPQVAQWASQLDPEDAIQAQALLECLWVFEEHRVPNMQLLQRIYRNVAEPRVRAATIRTLGHWGGKVNDWEATLLAAARDDEALVRAEAAKAAVAFKGLTAAEVIFEVATRPVDAELTTVLNYARSQINVDQVVQDAVKSGAKLSLAAQAYVLRNASVADLLKLDKTEAVYRAILSRKQANSSQLQDALAGLAKILKTNDLNLLLTLIIELDSQKDQGNLAGFARLLVQQPAERLQGIQGQLENLATKAKDAQLKQIGYAAWIAATGSGDDAYLAATTSKENLRDFLAAVPQIRDGKLRGTLYSKVRPLIFDLPTNMKAEGGGSSLQQRGIRVDYFYPNPANAARETMAKVKPTSSGIVPEIVMNVPQRKQADRFALRFTGSLLVPRSGKYTFFTNSDDGSRLYIDKKLVVNNDGNHGPQERSGSLNLTAGSHTIMVTYFDSGGGDGLAVNWSGPGLKKQKIAANRLSISGGETLHDVAIATLGTIPGHEADKFTDLASLVKAGKSRVAAIRVLKSIPAQHWPKKEIRPLADNLIGFLSGMPASYRTSDAAMNAIALANSLAGRLPADQAKTIQDRLKNLDVRVIAVGTVPHRMIYDKERLAIQAGKPVEFRVSNTDNMPHNFAITLPGALEEIGLLAEATARDPDAMDRQYVPRSDKILLASRLLQPGENQALSFEAPKTPGIYPYVCTYPGHWRRMYGALYVVADLAAYQANPTAYLAAHPLPLKDELLKFNTRGQDWKFSELVAAVKPLPMGRSYEVGKELFKVASCVACHRINNEGQQYGPDLTKLDAKKHNPEHLLRSLLEPDKEIDDKFQTTVFLLDSGKTITGLIVEETATTVKVIINPLAKAAPTVLKKSEIDARKKSPVSTMPKGLANKLSREEILDLLAYVYARGDMKHKLFEGGHKHKH
ncbi:MAG: PVC-type heme-binding CxxCH protein [Planctomycetota bacterium]|nr:PVC-type heme-binding CxxCH protein [Planctomycetota bacterium]